MPDAMAWVFPGQGAQEVGMGRALYERSATARRIFDRADALLGRPLTKLCFEGPAEDLNQTVSSQPAIYVMSIACLEVARDEGQLEAAPAFVAGHSLGEYSALTAAGALEFDRGVKLVETRGRVTQAAAEATPGRMAAVLGLDEDAARAVCDEAGAELCNINSPGQLVIGGATDAVDRACALALERGAKRAIPLDVSGAFHTSLMQPAIAPMQDAVAEAQLSAATIPIVTNDRATPVTDANAIGTELVYQLTHPVRWVQCVEYMAGAGVGEYIEIGPGRVLTGLIKRIASGATLRNINGSAP